MLEEAGEGLYRLKDRYRLPGGPGEPPFFLVSGEISTIYKRDGRTRKVHHLILLPSLDGARQLSRRLEQIGNLHSDGRPSWAWTAGTCWRFCWKPVPRRSISPLISGRPISPCSAHSPASIP